MSWFCLFDLRRRLFVSKLIRCDKTPPSKSLGARVKAVHAESVKYQYQSPFDENNFIKYWREAEQNQSEITNAAEKAMQIIQSRVNKWESLEK